MVLPEDVVIGIITMLWLFQLTSVVLHIADLQALGLFLVLVFSV